MISFKVFIIHYLTTSHFRYDRNRTWESPNLRDRAYFAAWFSNVYTMFYLNITNPKDKDHSRRFDYVNSKVGDKYKLNPDLDKASFEIRYDQMTTLPGYGDWIAMGRFRSNNSLSNPPTYPNPFKISATNFSDIGTSIRPAFSIFANQYPQPKHARIVIENPMQICPTSLFHVGWYMVQPS